MGTGIDTTWSVLGGGCRGLAVAMVVTALGGPALAGAPACVETWNEVANSGLVPLDTRITYDEVRDRTVLFGGQNQIGFGVPRNDTWEWDGAEWQEINPAGELPPPRTGHGLVYDAARGVTLLFGGGGATQRGDTWTWNGASWTEVAGAGPEPRELPAMAYDRDRQVVVLFGGLGASLYGDTWEFDGATWSRRATTGPQPRWGAALAYDEARGVTVLFGGSHGNTETWEWDGTSWTRRFSDGETPAGRRNHAMVYDRACGTVVLHGGDLFDTYADTWTWDGATWLEVTAPDGPGPHRRHGMTYDGRRGQVVIYGGGLPATTSTWIRGAIRDRIGFGLRVEALGQAVLESDAEGRLIISDIGSEGRDGFAVRLGTADGGAVEFFGLDAATLPVDARIVSDLRGELDGQADRSLGTVSIEREGDDLAIRPDFAALGGDTYFIDAYLEGQRIFSTEQPVINGGYVRTPVLERMSRETSVFLDGIPWGTVCVDAFGRVMPFTFSDLPGNVELWADVVVVRSAAQVPVGDVSRLDTRAARLSSLTLSGATVSRFSNHHRALRGTRLRSERGGLVVDKGEEKIASVSLRSGLFGLRSNQHIRLATDPARVEAGSGSSFEMSGFGTIEGERGTAYGRLGVRDNDGQLEIYSDFTRLGAATSRFDLYHRGDHVGTVVNNVLTPVGLPPFLAMNGMLLGPPPLNWEHRVYIDEFVANLAGAGPGGEVLVDEVRVTPVDPTITTGVVEGVELSAPGLDQFVITDETIETACVGDINGDGTVDTTDLVAVLAAWGDCPGCPEDLDGDDRVGVSDLLVVIARWGPCV